MNDILIGDLIVTQSGLRNPELLGDMIKFVKEGKFFTREEVKSWIEKNRPPYPNRKFLIQISSFSDGSLYIHDGHHRALSIILGGRTYLRGDEYEISEWTYAAYEKMSFEHNWLTPFNIKEEVRLPEFHDFKRRVWSICDNQSPQHARHLVMTRPELYKTKRLVRSIEEIHDISCASNA